MVNGTGEHDDQHGLEYAEAADLTAFIRWHQPRLQQWYRRCGLTSGDATDLAQEALAGLAQRWPELATEEHRRRSYYTIARSKVTDFWRKQGRRIQPVSLDDDEIDLMAEENTTNPEVMFAGGEHPVWVALAELPRARRRALVGRVLHRMSYDELAEATGRTEAALRQDVRRALIRLRRVLGVLLGLLGGADTTLRRARPRPVRAALSSATSAALAVVPQTALLSLFLTTPLHMAPPGRVLADAATALPRAVVRTLPGPVAQGIVVLAVPASPAYMVRGPRAAPPVMRHPLRRLASVAMAVPPVPSVRPPSVCVRSRCGTGERITVTVLGQETTVTQSRAELCEVVPTQASPHVTCSPGTDPT